MSCEVSSGTVRLLLSMIILYNKLYTDPEPHLDLEQLSIRLKNATEEDFSPFYLTKYIAEAIHVCNDEDITNFFEFTITSKEPQGRE